MDIKNETAAQQRLAAIFSANKDEITIPKIYVDMTDDIKAAAVLDELMFWTLPKRNTGKTSLRVFKNGALWLAVRRTDWWDRKRLSERQADGAISKLVELDIIEKDVFLFNGKPTVHIRLKMSNFVKLFGDKMQEQMEENGDESMVGDIADLYAMMGFPNETVNSILPNGEMLNSPNGEFINSLPQPPTTPLSEKTKKIVSRASLEWATVSGQSYSEDDIKANQFQEEAFNAFEDDMQCPDNWNWYGANDTDDKNWKVIRNFVVQQYTKNKECFKAYHTWSMEKYARGAMSVLAIKRNPENFPASWSSFLASNAMYGKKTSTVSTFPKMVNGRIVDDN